MNLEALKQQIRAAGGVVHSDGNIFFTNAAQFLTAATLASGAPPATLSKLRHIYKNLVNGGVRDTASAKRIAEGLLSPAIQSLELKVSGISPESPTSQTETGVQCECGDSYPADSWGAGFIAAMGRCANCDASMTRPRQTKGAEQACILLRSTIRTNSRDLNDWRDDVQQALEIMEGMLKP